MNNVVQNFNNVVGPFIASARETLAMKPQKSLSKLSDKRNSKKKKLSDKRKGHYPTAWAARASVSLIHDKPISRMPTSAVA